MSINGRGFSFSSVFFLQLALGVFFLMLGITGIQSHDSLLSRAASLLGNNDTMRVVMSVVEIAAGAILILGLFLSASSGVSALIGIALFALWIFYIVVTFFIDGMPSIRSFEIAKWVDWLLRLSWHSVILAGLWIVGGKYLSRQK